MSKDDRDIDRLVKEAVEKIRSRGGKDTFGEVFAVVKGKTSTASRAYKRLIDQEKADEEAALANLFNSGIGIAIHKDRDAFACEKTRMLNTALDRLDGVCEVLSEQIEELQSNRDALDGQLVSERVSHNEQLNSLELLNARLKGDLQAKSDQVVGMASELSATQTSRDDAVEQLSKQRDIIAQRTAETESARAQSTSLLQQLEAAITDRAKAIARLETADNATNQLQGQVIELTLQAEKRQQDLLSETRLRIEAQILCDAAKKRADELQAKLTPNAEQPPPAPPETKAAAKRKTPKTASSTK